LRGIAAAVPVKRQPTFAGSARQVRGALLRRLVGAPGHSVQAAGLDETIVSAMTAEGLLHRSGERVVLGGRLQSAHEPEGESR
jgi:hypothetical protein